MSVPFLTISFLYFFFHNPDSLICLSDDRNAVCPQLYSPVCALYSDFNCNSPTGYCLRTEPNGCTACSDPSVLGYILGDCPYTPVQPCPESPSLDPFPSIDIEGTVCGITQLAQDSTSLEKNVFDSGYEACIEGQAAYYLGGETLGECRAVSTANICPLEQKDPEDCGWSGLRACTYYQGGDCTEPLCRKTVDSYCVACSDPSALFYLNGDCEDLVPIGEDGILFEPDGPDQIIDSPVSEVEEMEQELEFGEEFMLDLFKNL